MIVVREYHESHSVTLPVSNKPLRCFPRRSNLETHFRKNNASRDPSYLYCHSHVTAKLHISIGGPFGEVVKKTGAASAQPIGFSTKYTDGETGLVYYGYRYYQTNLGRWISRDPVLERGGLNLYRFVKNDLLNRLDKYGLTGWVWIPSTTADYSISYDPAMTHRTYGAPSSYRSGTLAAEAYASYLGGLNNTIFQDYLHGHGAAVDLTANATIKNEVANALASRMNSAVVDIRNQVESSTCPGSISLPGLGLLSVSLFGDPGFTAINRTSFTSSVWVIGRASAGLSKDCSAIVFCMCNRPLFAVTVCDYHMYFYDQFADAADLHHTTPGAQEWNGGTQFDETGGWGRKVSQVGTYE